MQLSVVIPFYQVEKYIGACLDALAALPAEESEILLVDDCGRDGSAAIAAAKKDSDYLFQAEKPAPRVVFTTSGMNPDADSKRSRANEALRSLFGKE